MRKSPAALVVAIICCTATFAQTGNSKASFGFTTGMNLSTFRTAVDYYDFSPKIKAGFVFGTFIEIPLSSRFSFQPEFLYSQLGAKGSSFEWGDVKFRYNFFAIPLLFKYKAFKNFNIVAGPEGDILIRARKITSGKSESITYNIKDFDFLYTVGVEGWLTKNISLSARYLHGSQDVSLISETHTFFNQAVQLTVGYKLPHKVKKAKKEKKK